MSRKKTRQCRERGHNSCNEGAKRLRNTTALGTVSSGTALLLPQRTGTLCCSHTTSRSAHLHDPTTSRYARTSDKPHTVLSYWPTASDGAAGERNWGRVALSVQCRVSAVAWPNLSVVTRVGATHTEDVVARTAACRHRQQHHPTRNVSYTIWHGPTPVHTATQVTVNRNA